MQHTSCSALKPTSPVQDDGTPGGSLGRGGSGGLDRSVLAGVWKEIVGIMRIPTFAIIIIQASHGAVQR